MSIRGGYCFVIDGKEIIVYTGNGANFGHLGEIVLSWLKDFHKKSAAEKARFKSEIAGLTEVYPSTLVPEEDLREILQEHSFIRPLSINDDYDWYSVMRHLANDPQKVIDLGSYIDGSWMIDSVDCEYLYIIDFDEEVFEVYYDTAMASHLQASGRFNERAYQAEDEVTREEAQYINLLCSYTFEELPERIDNLQDDIYEQVFWDTFI